MVFVFQLFLFLLFVIFGLFLPGKVLLALLKLKSNLLQELFLSLGIGIPLFSLIAFVFTLLHVPWATLLFCLVVSIYALKTHTWKVSPYKNPPLATLVVLGVCIVGFAFPMLVTGVFGNTFVFRHDDVWHLSLINELKNHFPPDNPAQALIPLRGYHFFFNFLLAQASNLFAINVNDLYFHFFPPILSLLWGLGVYVLMKAWSKKEGVALWAVFLSMLGGSFAFILRLQGHGPSYSLDSAFGIAQPAFSLANPPFSLSIGLLLVALVCLYEYYQTKKFTWLIPFALCVGFAPVFKVYAGMLLFVCLGMVVLFELLRKNWKILFPAFGVGLLFFATYYVYVGQGGYLIWYPLWSPHTVLQSFPWYNFDNKMYVYSHLHVIHGLVQTELDGLQDFFLGNLGTRLFGLLLLLPIWWNNKRRPSLFSFNLLLIGIVAILIPLFFIQSGKVFEIIQMAWYFLFVMSLFAAWGLGTFFSLRFPIIIKLLLGLVFIALTLPSSYEILWGSYLDMHTGQSLKSPYFASMNFLATQGSYKDTVLAIPPQDVTPDVSSVTNWYLKNSLPDIPAFAAHRSFLQNEFIEFPLMQSDIREKVLTQVLFLAIREPHNEDLKKLVQRDFVTYGIRYIYSTYPIPGILELKNVKQIYKNNGYTIYKVY